MDDEQPIAALVVADVGGLCEPFARHTPWLAARLRRTPPGVVEDVQQETFIAIWRGARGCRAAGAWPWGIAVLSAKDASGPGTCCAQGRADTPDNAPEFPLCGLLRREGVAIPGPLGEPLPPIGRIGRHQTLLARFEDRLGP